MPENIIKLPLRNEVAKRLIGELNTALTRVPEYADSALRAYLTMILADPKYAVRLRDLRASSTDRRRGAQVSFEDNNYSYIVNQLGVGRRDQFGIRIGSFAKPDNICQPKEEDIFVLASIDEYPSEYAYPGDVVVIQYRTTSNEPIHERDSLRAVAHIEQFNTRFQLV